MAKRALVCRAGVLLCLGSAACGGGGEPASPVESGVGAADDRDGGAEPGGDGEADEPNAAPATFLPDETDFNGFHDWPSFPAEAADGVPLHFPELGPMTVYLNRPPPPGSSEFPPGTLIVKETNGGEPTARRVFALAKRGGRYNATGARGWEWFELSNRADGTVLQRWRGLGPPASTDGDDCEDGYGGDANGGCNGCHGAAAANDFVWTTALHLSTF